MTIALQKFSQFVQDLATKKHDLSSDVCKVMLTNTLPTATNAVYADVSGAELANGNGYATGGLAATEVSCVQTFGALKFVAAPMTWTATGSMGPFRYAVLYNSTPTSPLKPLIGWYDYGSSLTMIAGQTFTVNLDQTSGVFAIGSVLLTAAPGSIAAIGPPTAVTATRKIVPAVGSFTESGIASPTLWKRRLASTVGIYQESGVAAALAWKRQMAAVTGSYSETGIAAILTHGTSTNEPSGMTPVIVCGSMTATPATTNGGTWNQGLDGNGSALQWHNDSPTTVNANGEWAGNISIDSALGSGLRITYPSNVTGGFSPTRFGPQSFTNHGTLGTLYISFNVTYSSNWTDNGNLGCKLFDITIPTSMLVNHIIDSAIDQNHSPLDPTDAFLYLALQGPAVSTVNVPQITGSQQMRTLYPNSQMAGPSKGTTFFMEMVVQQDHPAGTGNGTYQAWRNGVSAVPLQTGLHVIPSSTSIGWNGIYFDPTYGGGSNHPPTGTAIYWTIDRLYASIA